MDWRKLKAGDRVSFLAWGSPKDGMALIQEFTFVVLTLMTSELWHGRGMSSGRADWFKRRNMNPRHGAALALVGWYLMMPPVNPTTNIEIIDAPISKWIIDSSHDSAKDCQAAIAKLREENEAVRRRHPDEPLWPDYGSAFAATCIATDDPRLNGN